MRSYICVTRDRFTYLFIYFENIIIQIRNENENLDIRPLKEGFEYLSELNYTGMENYTFIYFENFAHNT